MQYKAVERITSMALPEDKYEMAESAKTVDAFFNRNASATYDFESWRQQNKIEKPVTDEEKIKVYNEYVGSSSGRAHSYVEGVYAKNHGLTAKAGIFVDETADIKEENSNGGPSSVSKREMPTESVTTVIAMSKWNRYKARWNIYGYW